jgi:HSP20 family protein
MAEKTKEKETKALTPWRPFMDLTRWEREMDRTMDDFFGRRLRPWWPSIWSRGGDAEFITPTVDVYEEKDDIVVKAELPGMTKDDIEVDISDAHLILKGQKKKEELLRPDHVRGGLEENGAPDGKKIDFMLSP